MKQNTHTHTYSENTLTNTHPPTHRSSGDLRDMNKPLDHIPLALYPASPV